MKTSTPPAVRRPSARAWSLIEMIVVLTIIAGVLYMIVPPTSNLIIQSKVAGERSALQQMATAIQSSFNSSDFENTNLASIAGDVPTGTDPTAFTTNTSLTTLPSTTNTYDWFAKVGRIMGYTPNIGSAPTGAIAAILQNIYGNTRMVFAAPAETNQQRFMIVSLVSPSGELVLPAYQATKQWFDDIWNNQWNNTSSIPANWTTQLTAAQATAWAKGYGGTNCWKLVVIPITLRRYTISVSNTHPSDNGYIYYNGNTYPLHTGGDTVGFALAPAASGAQTVPASGSGILGGRQVLVSRGTTENAGYLMQFYVSDNSQIVIQ